VPASGLSSGRCLAKWPFGIAGRLCVSARRASYPRECVVCSRAGIEASGLFPRKRGGAAEGRIPVSVRTPPFFPLVLSRLQQSTWPTSEGFGASGSEFRLWTFGLSNARSAPPAMGADGRGGSVDCPCQSRCIRQSMKSRGGKTLLPNRGPWNLDAAFGAECRSDC